jgi:hypothetical protein
VKRRLPVALGRDLFEVDPPSLAGIDAQLLFGFSLHQIKGAFHIGSGEGLAVVPFDAVAQLEGEVRPVLAPRPAFGEIRNDRLQAVLLYVRVEHDEVVEHPHDRRHDRDRPLLEDRHVPRAVPVPHLENATLFLRLCRIGNHQAEQQTSRCRGASTNFHLFPPTGGTNSARCRNNREGRGRSIRNQPELAQSAA